MGFKDKNILELTIIAALIILLIFFFTDNKEEQTTQQNYTFYESQTIKVASWNLQIFGIKKWSEQSEEIIINIKPFDIIFIQEIRDSSGTAWNELCAEMIEYDCFISSRAGRSTSKEQYGVLYKKGIILLDTEDFNINPGNNVYWERPPLKASFKSGNLEFIAYTLHTRPLDAEIEIDNLYLYADKETGKTMVIGDLNADCNYYDTTIKSSFNNWYWVIPDGSDTTTGTTHCAYDRIIINQPLRNNLVSYGIVTTIPTTLSDHYIVWAELTT